MPLSQDFCDSPYQFMKKHIVVVTISDHFIKPNGNVVTAFVVEDDRADIAEPPAPQSKVFKLYLTEDPAAPKPPPQHTRRVYWCHYEPGVTHASMLGKGHAYMFTPTMNGCTLGIGSQNNGVVRVAHSNVAQSSAGMPNAKATIQLQAHRQVATLDARFEQANDPLKKIVPPFAYMKGSRGIDISRNATTFGRRNDRDEWKFYSLMYRKIDRTYYHFGVKDFTHGIV